MSPIAVFLWLLNIVVDTGGHIALKFAAAEPAADDTISSWLHMARRPWIWVGIACFGVEFVVWLAFLSLVPLSLGVLLGSINIVVLMLAGRIIFGETLTRLRSTGVFLIATGVFMVGLG